MTMIPTYYLLKYQKELFATKIHGAIGKKTLMFQNLPPGPKGLVVSPFLMGKLGV